MKKKKLTKEQKLKLRIKELEKQLRTALEDVQYYRGKYDGVKNDKEEEENKWNRRLNIQIDECRRKDDENWQLWTLIRLIVVPADKMEELNRIQQEEMRNIRPY